MFTNTDNADILLFNLKDKYSYLKGKEHCHIIKGKSCIDFLFSVTSRCFLESGRYGECVNIQQCPSIYRSFLQGNEIKDVCGYNGAFPFVCCPTGSASGKFYDKIQNSPIEPSKDCK